MASAVSYRQSSLCLCDLPCRKDSSTSRFCEQICRPLLAPSFFTECFQKTEKSVVMVSRKRCHNGHVYEVGRERKRKKTSDPTNSLPDKCLAPSKNLSRVDEVGNESKGKKISEPTNALPHKCFVPSKNLSRTNEVGSESKRTRTSEPRNPLPDSKGSVPKPYWVSSTEDSNLRAAMIKGRFADTMLRAQEKMIFNQDTKAEMDKFETRKANFKVELQVAETKLEDQRQREQQTARIGVVCEKKKTSEPTNSLPDERLVPSDSQSRISEPKAFVVSSPVDLNLRAAMIKSRFADTILRAQEKMILNQANKSEKETLKRRKANVEAELKFAETKLKEQRQKEREAARIALEKMERSVEWNHALETVQEFQRLIGVEFHLDVTPFDRGTFTW